MLCVAFDVFSVLCLILVCCVLCAACSILCVVCCILSRALLWCVVYKMCVSFVLCV